MTTNTTERRSDDSEERPMQADPKVLKIYEELVDEIRRRISQPYDHAAEKRRAALIERYMNRYIARHASSIFDPNLQQVMQDGWDKVCFLLSLRDNPVRRITRDGDQLNIHFRRQ
jgi:hypothetical protein